MIRKCIIVKFVEQGHIPIPAVEFLYFNNDKWTFRIGEAELFDEDDERTMLDIIEIQNSGTYEIRTIYRRT